METDSSGVIPLNLEPTRDGAILAQRGVPISSFKDAAIPGVSVFSVSNPESPSSLMDHLRSRFDVSNLRFEYLKDIPNTSPTDAIPSGRHTLPFHFEAETRETGLMDLLLIVADQCRLRIAIESNGLLQGDPRCLFKRIPSLFLKVDSWYLLNPSDPIRANLLDDGCVSHFPTSFFHSCELQGTHF